MDSHAALIRSFERQKLAFEHLGCPFYAVLSEKLRADLLEGGQTEMLLGPYADTPHDAAYVLRLLGGVHLAVLKGEVPALAAHFPSTGGDGNAEVAFGIVQDLLVTRTEEVLEAMEHPPQTNEVGRSIALTSGLMVVAERFGLPISLRELGASAGLNLLPDLYWFAQGDEGWGDARSPVRFVDVWSGGTPSFAAAPQIVDRRGCDRNPLDLSTRDGELRLLSYMWPQPQQRFERTRSAIAIARKNSPIVDRADIADWLKHELESRTSGTALVVFHSIVWQYLDDATHDVVVSELNEAGKSARPDRPLAWLRLEPHPAGHPAELWLTVWGDRDKAPTEQLLATTGFHGGPITWLEDSC